MRKNFILVLSLILICTLLISGCGQNKNVDAPSNESDTQTSEHTHTFGDWATVKEPTATEEGLEERTCDCGEKESRAIDKLEQEGSTGLEYALNSEEDSYSVAGIGECTDSEITLPTTYSDLPVTGIGYRAFFYSRQLTEITIPTSVTSIGDEAFGFCRSLLSINYSGTKAEWDAISKGSPWDAGTGDYTVFCTDCEISKDGTVTYH